MEDNTISENYSNIKIKGFLDNYLKGVIPSRIDKREDFAYSYYNEEYDNCE